MFTHPSTSRRHSTPAVVIANSYPPSRVSQSSQQQPNRPFHAMDPSYAQSASHLSPLHERNLDFPRGGNPGHLRSERSERSLSQSGHPNPNSVSGTVNGSISHMVPGVLRHRDESPEVQPAFRTSRTIPLPSQSNDRVGVSLHPALRFGRGPGDRAMVEMDISAMSVTMILQLARESRGFNEPATNPPLPSINVVHPGLPWSITVHPLSAGVTYVTVVDVLYAICQSLQLPLREDHWVGLEGGGMEESLLSRRRHAGQQSRSLKRLHLLHGKRNFVGLSRTAAEVALGAEIWRMNFV